MDDLTPRTWGPPAGRQFISCAFHPGGRPYTYHHDGEPVAIGTRVIVEANQGERRVTVVEILDTPPTFATKPIIGVAEETVDSPEEN